MAIYKVRYSSMTASYGPSYIEADSPEEAKRKFGKPGTFSEGERAFCMTAREVTLQEMKRALQNSDEGRD